jgi:phosphatidylinositol 4-kinase
VSVTTAAPSAAPAASLRPGRVEDSVSIIFNPGSTTQSKKIARLNNLRNLLLLLMSHELDRIVAWHNPRRVESGKFKDEHLFTSTSIVAALYPRDWKGYLDTAWLVDPRLAVRLAERFPMVTALRTELAELVKSHARSVYHVPEAVLYLATEANVKANAAELRHLIYWTPCTMPVALKLLAPPYSQHRTVKEYAVHSLRAHTNDNILFYLPQVSWHMRVFYDRESVLLNSVCCV